ncbi:MAG: VCBS repeat-containing protein [Acidobacteria bacterium]|nr:VCBS repeat-containing protein [Acidobacteriota bacterium]
MKKFLCALSLLFLLFAANAYSAVKTWDGGGVDANWTTAANWAGDVLPVAGDDLVFPATAAQYATTNGFLFSPNFHSMTIEGGNYTVGGSFISLSAGLTVNAGTQAINVGINMTGPQTFSAAQGTTTTVAILITNGNAVTLDGAGSFGIGFISGAGGIVKNGAGASLLAGASGYNGAITVNNGVFVVDANIPNSAVTVNNPNIGSGTLGVSGFGGTGTVGTVNVTQGAISAGTLTSPIGILNTGNLTFTANGVYAVKIGGTTAGASGHDQLNVTGTVNLNNARLAPVPWNGYRPVLGDSYTILKNDGTDPVSGTFLNAPEGAIFGGTLNTAFRITYHGGDGNDVVITRVNRAGFDFDGDGRSEASAFRPSNGTWNAALTGGGTLATAWGLAGDRLAPADYDGDNKTDLAVFRNGVWWILNSATGTVTSQQFGLPGDLPVPNDFDGDGRADIAVWRPSDGVWYELRSLGSQFFAQGFGQNGDQPLMGDFDGDGIGDLAVYRPTGGVWHLWMSATSTYVAFPFGIATDRPCAADYDGDGKTDPCVFRGTADPAQPDFFILKSSDSQPLYVSWGLPNDVPMLGDYDGDGKTDVGIFRSSSHDWYWLRSSNATVGSTNFGQTGDQSIPSAYVP